jgi:ribosomal protein S5
MEKTIMHKFSYSKSDIENLIKADISKRLNMSTIPIVSYSIDFKINTEFNSVEIELETPGE